MKKSRAHSFLSAKPVSIAQVALLSLAFVGCATRSVSDQSADNQPAATERHIKGTPQPNRWKEFLERAERGEFQEVRDEPEESSITTHLIDYQFAPVRKAAHSQAAVGSEVFKGKFRPEAKTSYAQAPNGKITDVESLLNSLPTDAQMTAQHHELVAKDRNHQNHVLRIPGEKRNVTVKAWLYWVKHQSDNDYHLLLGDTAEWSTETVFMNAEISGLPPGKPTQQPFVRLRGNLRNVLATSPPTKKGFFKNPLVVRVTGSLLWDGEHRNPHNVGPTKPVDIRPKKAWEIHPIHDFVH